MGIAQIENPGNPPAFGAGGTDLTQVFSQTCITVPCSAAVTANTLVVLNTNASTGITTCVTAVVASTAGPGGVALNSTTAAGQLVVVCIYGPCLLNTSATTFATHVCFSAGASGLPAAASATIGSNWGIWQQATSASTPAYAFIGKM